MPPLQPSAGRGAGALQRRARAWSAADRRRGESREWLARHDGRRLSWAGGQAQPRVSLLPSTPIGVRGLGPGAPAAPRGWGVSCFPEPCSFHPCPALFRRIPLLRVPGLPELPRTPLCPGWPLECAPGCACRGGGRGMTACRRERVAGRGVQGRTRSGSPPRARGHLAGLRASGRSCLVFLPSLTKPQPRRPGGRGPLRIAERNRQVGVYFQKRRGGAERRAASPSRRRSPCPGQPRRARAAFATGRSSVHPAAIELPPRNAPREVGSFIKI